MTIYWTPDFKGARNATPKAIHARLKLSTKLCLIKLKGAAETYFGMCI